ncbi:MAG: class I SAM-dependent DNA methyltransferase [Thermoleophilia bacterium]
MNQDEEFFFIDIGDERKKIRFHDYEEIYKIQGLYEHLFYERLKCDSPQVVAELLADEMNEGTKSMSDLNVLDLGAGNGIMGKVLAEMGVNSIVGVDIIDEAAEAAERDRPGVYDGYYVEDFTEIDDGLRCDLEKNNLNCMTCVAALGFNDIPMDAFTTGFNLLETEGLVAFNIKPDFMEVGDSTGFACLIKEAIEENCFKLNSVKSYRHRLSVSGDPIDYIAIVGTKVEDIPRDMCIDFLET